MVRSPAWRRRIVRWSAAVVGLAGVFLLVAALAIGRSRAADAPGQATVSPAPAEVAQSTIGDAGPDATNRARAVGLLGVGGGTPLERPPAPAAAPDLTLQGDGTAVQLPALNLDLEPTAAAFPPQPFTAGASPARKMDRTLPPVTCAEACFIRAIDDARTRDLLLRHGVRATYAHGGHLWAVAPPAAVDELRAAAGPEAATVVAAEALDTLSLYVLRLPDDATSADEEMVRGTGQIVDHVDNQFLVRVATLPPPALDLVRAGIWIEKLPPHPGPPLVPPASRPPLGDPADLAGDVSMDEMERSIVELTKLGGVDGEDGSRYYLDPGNVEAGEYLYRRLSEYGLKVWYEDFITNDGYLALNVVAELPGRDPSAVYLVLAHYDSTTERDVTAPGADDNATGVAGMLEIARVLAGYDLAYPVRFIATNVEEEGLQGAREFGVRARSEGIPFDAAFNLDATGSYAHESRLILNSDEDAAWIADLLVRMNDEYGLGQEMVVYQTDQIVADDTLLRNNGIPTVLLARELLGWSEFHHTIYDTPDKIDLNNVRTATQLVALALGVLAADG